MTAPDGRDAALGREHARTARRVSELETLVQQLCADVHTIARRVGGAAEADAERAPGSWLLADDPVVASAQLGDLVEWLHRVYLRYQGTWLPTCWLWHADAVEELWWLRCAHADAYDPDRGSWQRAADWHDRQRPGLVRRLTKDIGNCELSLHLPGARRAVPPTPVPLAPAATQIAAAWIDSGRHAPAPVPTPDQLAAAERHDHDQYRSQR